MHCLAGAVFALISLLSLLLASNGECASLKNVWTKEYPGTSTRGLSCQSGLLFLISAKDGKLENCELLAISPESGQVAWRAEGIGFYDDYLVSGGEVVFAYGDYDHSNDPFGMLGAKVPFLGGLAAYDIKTGVEHWRIPTPELKKPDAITDIDGDLLFATPLDVLHRMRRGAAKPLWSFAPAERDEKGLLKSGRYLPKFEGLRRRCRERVYFAQFIIAPDALYASSFQGINYKLDKNTGMVLGMEDEGNCRRYAPDALVPSDGILFRPTSDYRLEAREFPSMKKKWSAIAVPQSPPLAVGGAVAALEWGSLTHASSFELASALDAGFGETPLELHALFAFDRETGKVLWGYSGTVALTPPVAFRGRFYLADVSGVVIGLDPATGSVADRHDLGEEISSGLVTDGKALYVLDAKKRLHRLE